MRPKHFQDKLPAVVGKDISEQSASHPANTTKEFEESDILGQFFEEYSLAFN